MKRRLIPLLAAVLAGGTVHAGFSPIPLAPSSFNADVVVEKDASPVLNARTTASVDGGTNNTGNTWYEVGYNRDAPTTGLPAAGSTFTHQTLSGRTYKMAPSYTSANNAIMIDTAVTNGTFTLTTPAAYGALSIVGSSGNGGGNITVVTSYQDGSKSTNVFNPSDWFGRANPAWTANGRVTAPDFAFANVNGDNPRLNSSEFALANTTSPVVSISFYYTTGGANVHNVIMAVSGGATTNGPFAPITVTGYTFDMVVEAAAPVRGVILDTLGAPATTQTMDSDANTSNTWYERGLNQNNPPSIGTNAAFSGLPAPGSTITGPNGIYTFVMPPSYKAPNAAYFNTPLTPTLTITPATPTAATVLSFLGGSGGGQANLGYVVHHQSGATQTGTLPILDWFNGATPIFSARGRVSADTGVFNAVGSVNPKLFAADIVLQNTTSPVTSVDLSYTATGPRPAIFAMSGSTTDELPFFIVQPAGVRNYSGQNASLGAVASGTGTLTYQWQKGTNGVFVNVANGGNITGATTTNLVITAFTTANDADYRCVASNGAGSVNSSTVHLTVLSELTDVTNPGDPTSVPTGYGTDNAPGEAVSFAIDNTTSKWLNRDADNAAPFIGPAGMVVTPVVGRTIVSGIRLYTANDAEERDPRDYKLEGSNDGGATYTLISSNVLALPSGRNGGGATVDPLAQNMQQVLFPNTAGYTRYRLSFNNVKNNNNTGLMQIGEIELLGVVDTSVGLPTVAVTSTLANGIVGTTATMSGSVNGNPFPTSFWIKKNTGGDVVLTDGAKYSGATSTFLTINTLAFTDAGSYALVAQNSQGSVTSAPVVLTIFSDKKDITSDNTVNPPLTSTVTSFGGADEAGLEGTFAIDDTYASFENRGSGPNAGAGFPPFGGPVGLVITPSQSTIVSGLRIYANENNSGRDPLDYKLEGSNDGTTYTVLSSGAVNLPLARNPIANTVGPVNFDGLPNSVREFLFSNGVSYTSYRLTFSDIRNGGDVGESRIRVGEIELLGVVGTATPITVSITKQGGGQLQLQWTSGSLLEATNVTGPWTTNTTATSPFSVTPSLPQKFYQIQGQ
jgi:hypothetical protein